MKIQFKTKQLQKQYEDYRQANKVYPEEVARKYIQRINIIQQASNIEELKKLPAIHCHALLGKRQGQWAIKLTGYYRLIFSLEGDRLEIVRIEEVSKHYEG
jgi:toxin HigB-1